MCRTEVQPKVSPETSEVRSSGMVASTIVICDYCDRQGQDQASCWTPQLNLGKKDAQQHRAQAASVKRWCSLHITAAHEDSECRCKQ